MEISHYLSLVGWLEITASDNAITALRMVEKPKKTAETNSKVILQCIKELQEYFDKKRTDFEVKTSVAGTYFQEQVWEKLQEIPYGKTISYAVLAQSTGHPKAYRAAGSANGKNPIAIIIPCHRVIASGGGLGGYAYGLEMKKALLDLENR